MKLSFFKKQTQKQSIKRSHLIEFFAGLLVIVFLNIIGSYLFTRFDLTSEKRYTLSQSTKKMLKNVDDYVYFKIYLEGDLPSDFKRLRNETKEMLNQFRAYNKYVEYEFFNINEIPEADRRGFYQRMIEKGFQPSSIRTQGKDGKVTEQMIFPCADVTYKGREATIQLLKAQRFSDDENLLNSSIESLEYELSDAVRKMTLTHKKNIGFVVGHGEMSSVKLYDLIYSLSEYYILDSVLIDGHINSLATLSADSKDSSKVRYHNKFDALVIAQPTQAFSDKDLFIIDQYIMRGGSVLWLIDPLNASMDSLQFQESTIALKMPLRIENQLFKYGVRVNPNLVMDINCIPIPMKTSSVGEKPVISLVPWVFFPELYAGSDHPIVKNLNPVKSEFVSSVDTLENAINKTILLTTSRFSRILNAPAEIRLDEASQEPQERLYNKHFVPVAVLLEGEFESAFRNRIAPEIENAPEMEFRSKGVPAKMIVVGDGDIAKSQFNHKYGYPYPLGYDQYTRMTFGNKDFLLNALNYLCGDKDYLDSRSREIKIRKMDPMKIKEHETGIRLLNVILPIGLVLIFGISLYFVKRHRYTKK